MTVDESLDQFGLQPAPESLHAIRKLLSEELAKESASQGDGDTELMRLCCVQLFGVGKLEDVRLIWSAKTASMDADASIDIQLLCGAGLDAVRAHLLAVNEEWARKALQRLEESVTSGDFTDFDVQRQWREYSEYYTD